jgi:acetaldehyde dehydrogenase
VGKTKVAIVGSGNIATDLMMKILLLSDTLELVAMVGIDPDSDGLARASGLGIATTHRGIDGLLELDGFDEIEVVFDATSASSHLANDEVLRQYPITVVDLTPAAIGPFVVPVVNLAEHVASGARNLNMVTCGGQATIPIVHAVARVTPVIYAEIVASIASRSAGPGTRANIDEFTETTADALCTVGGAQRGKAVIVLNPAEPPLIMRDTVYCLIGSADHEQITVSIADMIDEVAQYVPGYRLKQDVQFTPVDAEEPISTLVGSSDSSVTTKVSVFLEVEGAAHYLPPFAGNLDIMTSAALKVGERVAQTRGKRPTAADSHV